MPEQINKEKEEQYSNKIFLNAVLPLLKTILEDTPSLQKKWKKHSVCQVSCLLNNGLTGNDGKDGIHFIFENGLCTPIKGCFAEKPDLELEFHSVEHLNLFFKSKTSKLPSLKGALKHPALLINFLGLLMKMGNLLGMSKAPKKEEDQKLLVKCMFYLLSRGINILNKMGHPEVYEWTENSPDRVYAWEVKGHPDLSAHLRIKKGQSMARRGAYTKSMPFFTMQFDSPLSALGILQGTADMIRFTIEGKLIMVGGPEYGAMLGDKMLLVGSYVK
ncbi:MAG: hypothetical protein ACTTHG_00055 [Treponemataceae bacterium]